MDAEEKPCNLQENTAISNGGQEVQTQVQESGKNGKNSKVELTSKQLKYITAVATGKSKVEAREAAGYDEKTSTGYIERSPKVKEAMRTVLDAVGVTSEYLARKIKSGIEVKKKQFYSFKGRVRQEKEVEDTENQYKFARLAHELRGDLSVDNAPQVNIGIVEVPGKGVVWNPGDPKEPQGEPIAA